MKDLKDLLNGLQNLNYDIGSIIRKSQYENYDDLSGLDFNLKNPEEKFLRNELIKILESLSDVQNQINYLCKEGKEFVLHKNSRGRYENSVREYTSGQVIEFCYYDELDEEYVWEKSAVEHDGEDYFIVGYSEIKMDGLKVKERI